jgi:hypothetical protein
MKPFIIITVVLAIGAALFLFRNAALVSDRSGGSPRVITPQEIAVNQIPAVVEQLKANGTEGSWAAFAFSPPGEPTNDQTGLNLQYSVDRGVVGLDWVLLGPRNKADKEKVIGFIKQRKHSVQEKDMNGVQYLRIEDGDISELGVQIAAELYRLGQDGHMGMFTDKFTWQP